MNAFYATQQLFDKAYGNFLGLSHLGAFIANEMGLRLEQLNIFAGIEKLERITSKDPELAKTVDIVRAVLQDRNDST